MQVPCVFGKCFVFLFFLTFKLLKLAKRIKETKIYIKRNPNDLINMLID